MMKLVVMRIILEIVYGLLPISHQDVAVSAMKTLIDLFYN